MKDKDNFLGANWLLDTAEGIKLYHDVAVPLRKEVGIIDTHTHHNLRQIVENEPFPNIWRAEVLEEREEYKNCDHYIIQLAAKIPGFSQKFARDPRIPDYDKWVALCEVFPKLEGNHVHQWMHLDLIRMFGIQELLSAETADKVWEVTNKYLQRKEMLPQSILKKIGAKIIFTTDDPADDLIYHKMANSIEGITFLPTFRPDAYCNLFDDNWKSNVEKICQLTGQDATLKGLVEALRIRHSYFTERGAKASDHGLLEPYGLKISQKRAEQILYQAYNKKEKFDLRSIEVKEFISYMMHQFCAMNQDKDMITQIHYGAVRNANEYLFKNWGADVGGDVSAESVNIVDNLQPLLSRFFSGEDKNQSHLILYPMNQIFAHTNVMLERAFPNVHSGFPWWHNDSPYVMEQYLLHTASSSLLTSSGGPVCDGRKILSEGSRFEVFDRIICKAVGNLVSNGQITYNGGVRMLKALMYENQIRLFNLKGEFNE
ncbi:MAG: glucuronate isomerase [Candidatus Caldatribacteriota bacterium]|nr:glucuronate isomerase [Candidatus Caldatribacteriota bacterium]